MSETDNVKRAIETLEKGCKHYCEWYETGSSCDAENFTYDLVTYMRYTLASLRKDDAIRQAMGNILAAIERERMSCYGSISLGTACGKCEGCVHKWRVRNNRLRQELLAALIECQGYDELYSRAMELTERYDPESTNE